MSTTARRMVPRWQDLRPSCVAEPMPGVYEFTDNARFRTNVVHGFINQGAGTCVVAINHFVAGNEEGAQILERALYVGQNSVEAPFGPMIVRISGFVPRIDDGVDRAAAAEEQARIQRETLLRDPRFGGPDFAIVCPQCRGNNVLGENRLMLEEEFSVLSGTLDFVCQSCTYRRVFYAPAEPYWTNPRLIEIVGEPATAPVG